MGKNIQNFKLYHIINYFLNFQTHQDFLTIIILLLIVITAIIMNIIMTFIFIIAQKNFLFISSIMTKFTIHFYFVKYVTMFLKIKSFNKIILIFEKKY